MPDLRGGDIPPEDEHEAQPDGTSPAPPGSGWITPPPDELGWQQEQPGPDPFQSGSDEYFGQLPPRAPEPRDSPGPPEPPETPKKKRGIFRRILRDVVVPLVIAFGVAMIFQATIAKPYQIPSGSMIPTIQDNDRILADRVVYHFESIHRGDVIVFNPPAELNSDTPFVKRVIGLPGDTVEIKGGQVLIDKHDGKGPQPFVVPQARPTTYTMPAETVPAGQLFVLGDNRDESYDSHRWGCVSIDNVIGRAEAIYWPLNHLSLLGE